MKSNRRKALSFAAALLSALTIQTAQAQIFEASQDTHVKLDNSGPYGGSQALEVYTVGNLLSALDAGKAMMRFPLSGVENAIGAQLLLDVSFFHSFLFMPSTEVYLWGANNGCGAELFTESTARYNNFAVWANDKDGILDTTGCIYDGDPTKAGLQPLGALTVTIQDVNQTVTFSSRALLEYLKADNNNNATIIITSKASLGAVKFASKEHATLNPPRLSLVTKADTFVRINNEGPYGSDPQILVKNSSTSHSTRKGLIRVGVDSAADVLNAELALYVSSYDDSANAPNAVFSVFGIKDGDGYENFDGSMMKYDNLAGLFANDADGVDSNSTHLHDANPNTATKQALGDLVIQRSDLNQKVLFKTPELREFIKADTNGYATFLITRTTYSPSLNTGFASNEHGSLPGPALAVTSSNSVELPNFDTNAVQNSNGSWQYNGTLRLPLFGGEYVTLPGAAVTMVLDSKKRLQSISGTVGFPELPEMGLFSALGEMGGAGQSLQIGYDYPVAFDNVGLPLDPDAKYFYLVQQSGSSLEWGSLSIASPNAGAMMMAIDPVAVAFFFYASELFPNCPISDIRAGVSGSNSILFNDPWYSAGVEEYMTDFYGDLYLGGVLSLPLAGLPVDLVVEGDATVDADDDAFIAGNPSEWISDMAVNGAVSMSAELGNFGLNYYLGGATLRYHHGANSYLAFSGELAPQDLGFPFAPKANMRIMGYIDENSNDNNPSFVELDGEFSIGAGFAKQKMEGNIRISEDGASINGTADFGGLRMNVFGSANNSYARFGGSANTDFDFRVGSVDVEIKATFDTRNTSVSLSADAEICVDYLGCAGAGIDEISINDDGKIRVCVSGLGQSVCDDLDI